MKIKAIGLIALSILGAQMGIARSEENKGNLPAHDARYYVHPSRIDGVCTARRPSPGENPLTYMQKTAKDNRGKSVDIDCINRYYGTELLKKYSDHGDLVAVYVYEIQSKKFLTAPCESDFRKFLNIILLDDEYFDNRKFSDNFSRDVYFTAAVIEGDCGSMSLATKYYSHVGSDELYMSRAQSFLNNTVASKSAPVMKIEN